MKPIIKEGVRILRPFEFNILLNAIPKLDHQIQLKTLLFTGMRYAECKTFFNKPEWLEQDFIHLPSTKKKARQRERWIRLNPRGKEVVQHCLSLKKGLPHRVTWYENLHRWIKDANLQDTGMSIKTTRKTWESWLLFYYPSHQIHIMQSQGHSDVVSFKHYLNMPFNDEDKIHMKQFVEGWI